MRSFTAEAYIATGRAITESGNADAFVRSAAAARAGKPVDIDTDGLLTDIERLSALIAELEARRDDLIRLGKNVAGRDLLARAAGKSVTWVRQRLAGDPEIADLREANLTRDGARWRLRRHTPLGR